MEKLTLLNFYKLFPDEASCEAELQHIRESSGLRCCCCGCMKLYWDKVRKSLICSKLRYKTTLHSGTVFKTTS